MGWEDWEDQSKEPSMRALYRLRFVHVLYLTSFILITIVFFKSLQTNGVYFNDGANVGCILGTIAAVIIQGVTYYAGVKGTYFKYCNISLMGFIISTFVQFGVALHYTHLNAANKDEIKFVTSSSTANITTGAIIGNPRNDCINLQNDMFSYIVLLIPLPLLIITSMIYPYPENFKTTRSTILNGINMLDFIDMADLMFADIGCYQTFSKGWLVVFYLALGVSVILTAFSNGLERKDSNVNFFDKAITSCNMIFNDFLFLVLRINTMLQTGHVYFGLIFAVKELFSFFFRLMLLCCDNVI